MWAGILFFIAFVLLVVFLIFRSWEMRRGVRILAGPRSDMDVVAERVYGVLVTGSIPEQYRFALIAFGRRTVHLGVVLLVHVLRGVERPLLRLSHRMRTSTPSANGKEVSPFLKTITPDKSSSSENTDTSV